jgi:hypothetical protein
MGDVSICAIKLFVGKVVECAAKMEVIVLRFVIFRSCE